MDIEHLTDTADRRRLEPLGVTCVICHCLVQDPVQCQEGHLFCHRCLNTWMTGPNRSARSRGCPTCGKNLPDPVMKNRAIRDLLAPCPCKCPNACGWKGTVREFYGSSTEVIREDGHYDADGVTCPSCLRVFPDVTCTGQLQSAHLCPDEILTCKHAKPRLAVSYVANGFYYTHTHTKIGVATTNQFCHKGFYQGYCGTMVRRKDEHHHVCSYEMVRCVCTWTGWRFERPAHVATCSFLWPLCPMWGCNERYPEGQELQHRKEFHKWSLEADADAWDDVLHAQEVLHTHMPKKSMEKAMRCLMNSPQ